MRHEFSKEWLLSIPKTIDQNECWIPLNRVSKPNGYIKVNIKDKIFLLHRMSMCLFHNVDYNDSSIDTRHSNICNKACFNPNHLQPGTRSQNMNDLVNNGTHYQTRKTHCKCGNPFDRFSYKRRKVGIIVKISLIKRCSKCELLNSRGQKAKRKQLDS